MIVSPVFEKLSRTFQSPKGTKTDDKYASGASHLQFSTRERRFAVARPLVLYLTDNYAFSVTNKNMEDGFPFFEMAVAGDGKLVKFLAPFFAEAASMEETSLDGSNKGMGL